MIAILYMLCFIVHFKRYKVCLGVVHKYDNGVIISGVCCVCLLCYNLLVVVCYGQILVKKAKYYNRKQALTYFTVDWRHSRGVLPIFCGASVFMLYMS